MNKNYVIWGISDEGYRDNISSSYADNIIPKEFKFTDVRSEAAAFHLENPNESYFYSIEQVGNNVLYTIYRTNVKDKLKRQAYNAATIIISKNHIIEKPLNSLKSLININNKKSTTKINNKNQ